MRNTRTASRLLALALTVLMLASCFVALPAMAEETAVTSAKTTLWQHNFATAGANKDGNVAWDDLPAYLSDNKVFTLKAMTKEGAANPTQITNGYFNVGYGFASGVGGQDVAIKNDSANNTLFQLMTGEYSGYDTTEAPAYFMEFDWYYNMAPTTRTDTSGNSFTDQDGKTTTGLTLCTDYGSGSAGVILRLRSKSQSGELLRLSANGYLYTSDNRGETTTVAQRGIDGYVYYTDDIEGVDTKVYFDTDGYRYTLGSDGMTRVYIDKREKDPGTLSGLSLGYTVANINNAYKVTINKEYRIGVSINVTKTATNTDGKFCNTLVYTVYIKEKNAENWEKCLGTSTQLYYELGYSDTANETNDVVTISDGGRMFFGGMWEVYAYDRATTHTAHVNILESRDAADATRITCTCIDCGYSCQEREIDGLRYKGELKGNACEGTYYVWAPKDTTAVGVPFADSEYTTKPAGHTYGASGKCTVTGCGEYEFITEIPKDFFASAPIKNGAYPDLNSTYWDRENLEIKGQTSTPVLLLRDERDTSFGAARKPFTISFDFRLDSCTFNGKLNSFGELISLVPEGSNGAAASGMGQALLYIGLTNPGGAASEQKPYIAFSKDFATYTVSVGMVDDGGGNLVPDPGHTNYSKLQSALTYFGEGAYTHDNGTTTRKYTFRDHNAAAYYLTYKKWINVQCTVVPHATDNASTMVLLYVNGELVNMRPAGLGVSWDTKFDGVRFGPGSARYTMPTFRLDNVGIQLHDSLEDAYADVKASNQVISFGFDRYQARLGNPLGSAGVIGASLNNDYPCVGRFTDNLDDSLELINGGEYAHYDHSAANLGSSERLQFSLTGLDENENKIEFVSQYKYEISTTLAIDRALTATGAEYGSNRDMIRLSKFRDAYVKLILMQLGPNGYLGAVAGKWLYLVDEAGHALSPYTEMDETTGLPLKFSNVRVVVDEKANTYSIFVDDRTAYYEKDGDRLPFVNITMPAPTGTGVDKTKETNEDGALVYSFKGDVTKYHDYTRAFFETLVENEVFKNNKGEVLSYQYDCEYLCLFQTFEDFYLKDVKVSIIPDSKIEMIGVQDQIDADDNLALRFIAGIDDVFVPGIGYSVEAWHRVVQSDGTFGSWERTDRVQTENSRVVFRSIKETDANGKVDSYYAYNRQEGDYLSALKITDIPRDHGVNEQYKFTVTPYTLDADGNVDKTFESYTAIYNGAGEYLGNGQPFEVDLSEYKAFTESPNVILELKDGAGDYNDFYVYTRTSDPSGRYYIRYCVYYSYSEAVTNITNSATNIRSFRINTAHVVKVTDIGDTVVTCTEVMPMLGGGEISLAIKEYKYGQTANKEGELQYEADGTTPKMGNAVQDFIGGYHGDEHIKKDSEGNDMFSLVMDEREYVPGQGNLVVTGNEIVIEQTTLLDRWEEGLGSDEKKEQVAEHAQTFTINKDGVAIDRTVKWLVDDFLIEDAYVMMLTLRRCTTETITNDDGSKTVRAVDPICEKVATYNADGTKIASVDSGADMNTNPGNSRLSSTQVREVRYSSDTSGAFAVAKFDMAEGSNGGFSAVRVDFRDGTAADNKLYVPMTATGGTGKVEETGKSYKKPSVNETWVLDTFFKLDYVNPNN